MKKSLMTSLVALTIALNAAGAYAAGIGYVDYGKVSTQYSLAKRYTADLDKKVAAIKSYEAAQANSIKAAKTNEEKKKIADNALAQIKAKQKDYVTTRNKYETELTAKVVAAAEQVRVSKKLDIIIRKDSRVTGGVDCTQDVLNILK